MSDPTRIIAQNLRGRNTLVGNLPVVGEFIGDASAKDVLYAVVIPLFTTMILFEQLPESFGQYSFYVILGVIAIGFGIIAAVPSYTSISGLISQFRKYHTRATESRMSETDTEDEDISHRRWQTSESTIEKTHVERIYGNRGVIERDDGVVVGAMRVRGMNLDTATDRTEKSATRGFENFLTSQLDFPIQIYVTTRQFNSDEYLDKFEERQDDKEITDNPVMEMYLNHYIERTPLFLSRQYYREYYIMVPVSRWDVRERSREAGALNLSSIPVIGEIAAEIFGKSDISELTENQIKQRQIDEVFKRLEKVKQGGISKLDGADADILRDANEYASLIKEFWEGRDMSFKRDKDFIRDSPISMGETDLESVNEHRDTVDSDEFIEEMADKGDEQ